MGYPLEAVQRLFDLAFDQGLKGFTAFPLGPMSGGVLEPADAACAACVHGETSKSPKP